MHPVLAHPFSVLNLGDLPLAPMCYSSGVPKAFHGIACKALLPPILPTPALAMHTWAISHLTLLTVFLPVGIQLSCFFTDLILHHSGITLHLCPFLSIGSFLLCTLLNTGVHTLHTVLERITSFPRLPRYILGSLNMFWGIRSYSPSLRHFFSMLRRYFTV